MKKLILCAIIGMMALAAAAQTVQHGLVLEYREAARLDFYILRGTPELKAAIIDSDYRRVPELEGRSCGVVVRLEEN